MKARAASKDAESGGMPAAAKENVTAEFPAAGDEPEDAESEDVFKEIPTVANRANPTGGVIAAGDNASSVVGQREDAGTYRILRPTTSDFVDTPAATKNDPNAAKRLIIGPARKPR
jgi:hypothetical protein